MNKTETHDEKRLKGIYGIALTPFDPQRNVDINQLTQNLVALCDSPVDGVVVCGSTSEFVHLSAAENREIMRTARQVIGKRTRLICGATAPDAKTTLAYLEQAAALEVRYALVAPPYYYQFQNREIVQFYKEISENGMGVGIIAYQIPQFTNNIDMDVFVRLMDMPGVAGLKNSSANIKQIMHQLDLRNRTRDDFSLFTGTDDAFVPCLAAGCDGSMTAFGALLPQVIRAIHTEIVHGRLQTALRLQAAIMPLLRAADSMTFPIGYKVLSSALGMPNGSYRQSLDDAQLQEIAALEKRFTELLRSFEQAMERVETIDTSHGGETL